VYTRKSKDTKLQKQDIKFCAACAKPLAGDYYTILHKFQGKVIWHYHNTPQECAEAPAIKKDWRRIVKREQAETHNRTKARLQEGDGYSWDTNDSLSMR
jgi:hypothetical protein